MGGNAGISGLFKSKVRGFYLEVQRLEAATSNGVL